MGIVKGTLRGSLKNSTKKTRDDYLRLQQRRNHSNPVAVFPINQNSEFTEPNGTGWTEEETGDASGVVDFSTLGFALFTSTLLGGIFIKQTILEVDATYRVEIDVSSYVSGSLTIVNDTDDVDCGITSTGTFAVQFVAKTTVFSIGLLLGSIKALTCSAIRVYRV